MNTFLRNMLPAYVVGTLVLLLFVSATAQVDKRDDGPTVHDFAGTWTFIQENGFVVTMELQQNGKEITGKASYNAGRKGIARGTVKGRAWTIKDRSGWVCGCDIDHFQVEITWHHGVGVYHAHSPFGASYLRGQTWPKGNPAGKVVWSTKPDTFRRRR